MADTSPPVTVEFLPSSHSKEKLPPSADPFRHQSLVNSHNHHDRHPWGSDVEPGTEQFHALYAEANNKYMYHLWYTPALAPYMATKVLAVSKFEESFTTTLTEVVKETLRVGAEAALQSPNALLLIADIQKILAQAGLSQEDRIFVRLGATSVKDTYATDVPTTKPSPMKPDATAVLSRIITSGRCVGRLLALSEHNWPADPGEALIIERWSPQIELRREFRVFCYEGRVTAISQDIWWEDLGWRKEYSPGFVDTIVQLWEKVKGHVPFDTCTMDVLMTSDSNGWNAGLIEFNGFGAHLNTGSDLFHWANDYDILHGKKDGITLRFVDDLQSDHGSKTDDVEVKKAEESMAKLDLADDDQDAEAVPDWLALEEKLRLNFSGDPGAEKRLEPETKLHLPLRGRWCSAY